ncbi:TetR/AcrR family transcriptional regulator [Microbacterium sp. 179-I 3D2 NHS]|uniref:TetR/AcrR family transcriptional regulator n=1 Tax=Microbacterium sp. 179-I 3D2 NHS TaxID=3235178 RepID=UPI0039A06772
MTGERIPENDSRSRQKRVGDALRHDTRNRVLEAAEIEFTANGYIATTVTRLAAAAGVSVQTLYSAWGSKRALLRGYMERTLAGGAASPEDAAARFTDDLTPRQRLEELADLFTEIADRASTGWTLYRDAAAVDPEIADDWNDLQRLRHGLFTRIIGDIPTDALAPGLSRKTAVDTAWAIASPETFDLLVGRRGYTPDELRAWLRRTLVGAILGR